MTSSAPESPLDAYTDGVEDERAAVRDAIRDRDDAAMLVVILTLLGVVLAAVGAGLVAGAGVGLIVAGGLLVVLGLAAGFES